MTTHCQLICCFISFRSFLWRGHSGYSTRTAAARCPWPSSSRPCTSSPARARTRKYLSSSKCTTSTVGVTVCMELKLYVYSELCAQLQNEIGNLICLRHLFRSTAVAKQIFFLKKILVTTCVQRFLSHHILFVYILICR